MSLSVNLPRFQALGLEAFRLYTAHPLSSKMTIIATGVLAIPLTYRVLQFVGFSLPRHIVTYGCRYQSSKIVQIFSRFVDSRNLAHTLMDQSRTSDLMFVLKNMSTPLSSTELELLVTEAKELRRVDCLEKLFEANLLTATSMHNVDTLLAREILKKNNPSFTYFVIKSASHFPAHKWAETIEQLWNLKETIHTPGQKKEWAQILFPFIKKTYRSQGQSAQLKKKGIDVLKCWAILYQILSPRAGDKEWLQEEQALLFAAIEENHLEVIRLLLEAGVNPNFRNFERKTPLHLAAESGKIDIIYELIQRKALLEAKDFGDLTPLETSIQASKIQATRVLYEGGAALPNKKFYLMRALDQVLEAINEEAVSSPFFHLLMAVLQKTTIQDRPHLLEKVSLVLCQTPCVEKLIAEHKVNGVLTEDGWTLLHLAVAVDKSDFISYLLENGWKIDAKVVSSKMTVLHLATLYDASKSIQFLLSNFPQLLKERACISGEFLTSFEMLLRVNNGVEGSIYIELCNPQDLLPSLYDHLQMLAEPFALITEEMLQNNPELQEADVQRELHHEKLLQLLGILLRKDLFFKKNLQEIVFCLRHNGPIEKLILLLTKHKFYLPYLNEIGYEKMDPLTAGLLAELLQKEERVVDLVETMTKKVLEWKKATVPIPRDEMILLKDALRTLEAMHRMLYVPIPYSTNNDSISVFAQLSKEIESILQKTQSKASQQISFIEIYDEEDGMVLLGNLFTDSTTKRELVNNYCQRAFKMGLREGRDFRIVGIDDNIKRFSQEPEASNPKKKKEIEDKLAAEILRKIELMRKWEAVGACQIHAFPTLTWKIEQLIQWEIIVNQALFTLLLPAQSKLEQLLQSQNVEALSELKNIDLISELLKLAKVQES